LKAALSPVIVPPINLEKHVAKGFDPASRRRVETAMERMRKAMKAADTHSNVENFEEMIRASDELMRGLARVLIDIGAAARERSAD
jgi:hypothetical protein